MSTVLLQEYVTLVLEKIRTKKGQKGLFGQQFDMKKFKSLDNYHAMLVYADQFLDTLGQGSSRAAFLLSNRYVLKIAINDKGLAQNEAEVNVYTNPASQPVVAKVHQFDEQYNWVVADVVKPIKSVSEFVQLTGIEWQEFSEEVDAGIKHQTLNKDAPKFIRAIVQTALKNDLLRGDLAQQDWSRDPKKDVLDHYGKTPDGRVVLLDYGFTGEVWKSHYSSSGVHNKPQANSPDKTTGVRPQGPTQQRSNDQTVDPHASTAPAKTAAERPRKKQAEDPDKTRR